MGNPFVWVELHTQEPSKMKKFYGSLFDWNLEDIQVNGRAYTMVQVGEGTGGGIMQHPVPGAPAQWLAFVLVEDVAALSEKASALGATVLQGPTEVPGYGWFSVITDPEGAHLGLWQPTGAM